MSDIDIDAEIQDPRVRENVHVKLERLADGDADLERELEEAVELWVRELSQLLRAAGSDEASPASRVSPSHGMVRASSETRFEDWLSQSTPRMSNAAPQLNEQR